jgi:putative endonuclease
VKTLVFAFENCIENLEAKNVQPTAPSLTEKNKFPIFVHMQQSYVYILKCSDNSYYTGITSNLEQRMLQHNIAFYPDCYTTSRRPLELVFYAEFTDINLAIEKEKQIKKWSRAKKEALINDDYDSLPNLAKKKF